MPDIKISNGIFFANLLLMTLILKIMNEMNDSNK